MASKGGLAKLEMVFGISSAGHLVTDPHEKNTFYHPIGNGIRCVHGGEVKDTTLLQGHSDVVNCVAMSPDGTCLASSQLGKNTDIILWNVETFEKRCVLQTHDLGVCALAFSQDSKLLASVGNAKDDRVYIWDVVSGNYVCNASLKGRSFEHACWRGSLDERGGSRGGSYVFVTCGASGVFVYTVDPYTGDLSAPVGCNSGSVKRHYTFCCFDETGDVFFCGTTSGDVLSYTYKTTILKDVRSVCKGRINAMCKPKGQDVIYVGSEDRCVYAFDSRSGSSAPLVRLEAGIKAMALGVGDKDGANMVYVSTSDCTIWRTFLDKRGPLGEASVLACERMEENHSCAITCLAATATETGGYWFSSDTKGHICMWDSACRMKLKHSLETLKPKSVGIGQSLADATVMATSMVLLPSLNATDPKPRILCGKSDGSIEVFCAHQEGTGSYELRSEWEMDHAHRGSAVTAITSHMEIMATGSASGEVNVWDARTRRLISARKDHVSTVTGVELIQDATVVVSISKDTQCKYYNWEKGISGVFFVMEASRLNGVCGTRPDESVLVSVGSDKHLTTWDLDRTETVFSVQAHTMEATCLSLSPNNDLVVTGGADRVLRVWTLGTGHLVAALEGHCGTVTAVTFISHNKIISADESGTLILWNVQV